MLSDLAPAKINLFLHVLGRREDGYHLLESLVAFADVGDHLTLEPGRPLSLVIEGPMAAGLAAETDNLVLRAARLFAEAFPGAETGRFTLLKRLPVASGIGGGSSDAATALRLLARLNGVSLAEAPLLAIARALGADVPVCLEAQPRLMRGIGHDLGPALSFEGLPALLVNPRVAVETRAVFTALGLKPGARFTPVAEPASGEDLPDFARDTRNDLEAPAKALAPDIDKVLAALRASDGCRHARMSGSGATVFALFADEAAQAAAARAAGLAGWWAEPCRIQIPR